MSDNLKEGKKKAEELLSSGPLTPSVRYGKFCGCWEHECKVCTLSAKHSHYKGVHGMLCFLAASLSKNLGLVVTIIITHSNYFSVSDWLKPHA